MYPMCHFDAMESVFQVTNSNSLSIQQVFDQSAFPGANGANDLRQRKPWETHENHRKTMGKREEHGD